MNILKLHELKIFASKNGGQFAAALSGQFNRRTQYCMKEKIELLQSFEDAGSDSTISNRSGWKALETFLQHHNGKVNFLVVANLDRIGRKFSLVQERCSS